MRSTRPSTVTIKTDEILTAYRELPADLETPVGAYIKLARKSAYAFLLESVNQVERWGRYSFIGVDPESVFFGSGKTVTILDGKSKRTLTLDSPLSYVKEELSRHRLPHIPSLPPFQGGYVGYLGYDCVRYFEELPSTLPLRSDAPDFLFMRVRQFIVFDNFKQTMMVVVHVPIAKSVRAATQDAETALDALVARLRKPLRPEEHALAKPKRAGDFRPAVSKAAYEASVEQAKSYIRAGDIFQVVLSMEFQAKGTYDPLSLYRVLRTVNPSPYLYLLKLGSFSVVGSSPEIMVRKEGDRAVLRPIAGTRKRGATPDEDLAMERELREDPKEKAEHIMLVDLGRNDLGRVCKAGTVHMTAESMTERYSHVMHLVSEVEGELKADKDWFDLLASAFPAGTLSGAPKIRAMEIIEELEKSRRGVYGGSIGYIGFDGNVDMAIAIRTLVAHKNYLVLRAGAGIVQDSKPELEHKECLNKAKALMAVCERLKSK